jgi:hypothetical protein
VWTFANNTNWTLLHPYSAKTLVVADLDGGGRDDVVIDFGAPGLWLYMNNISWESLHSLSAKAISLLRP